MANARRGVVVFGEVLCDLFAHRVGEPLSTTSAFVPVQGGAPANVAVQLARLGIPTALITAVGSDPLGERVRRSLAADGVDTGAVVTRPGRRTGVTLVEVDPSGERRFFGFRENSADLSLGLQDLDTPTVRRALQRAAVVHTGTVSLRSPSARRATRALQRAARRQGSVVSLDVNLRPGMFPSLAGLIALARAAVGLADVVKATREEAEQLLGVGPLAGRRTVSRRRAHDDVLVDGLLGMGPRLVALTLADEGAVVAHARARAVVAAPPTTVVDATGAGDGFVGAVLAELVDGGVGRDRLSALADDELAALGAAGCRAGAAVVTALGATTAMLRGAPVGACRAGGASALPSSPSSPSSRRRLP
jgi:fructokinase